MYRLLFISFFAAVLSACTGTLSPGSTSPVPGRVYESGQSVRQNVEITDSGLVACPSFREGMSREEAHQVRACHDNYMRWHRAGLTQQRENEQQALARRRQTGREVDDVFKRAHTGVRIFDQVVRTVDRRRSRR